MYSIDTDYIGVVPLESVTNSKAKYLGRVVKYKGTVNVTYTEDELVIMVGDRKYKIDLSRQAGFGQIIKGK